MVIGSALTLLGAIGLLRLPTFYERIHAPTLGTSWGVGAIMLASIIYFSIAGSSPRVLHEILIGIFVTLTTPITLILLARAALHVIAPRGTHLFLRRFCQRRSLMPKLKDTGRTAINSA